MERTKQRNRKRLPLVCTIVAGMSLLPKIFAAAGFAVEEPNGFRQVYEES
jgi:hypothetical protein